VEDVQTFPVDMIIITASHAVQLIVKLWQLIFCFEFELADI